MGKRKRGLEDVDTDSVQNRDTRVSLGAAGKIIDPSPKQEVVGPLHGVVYHHLIYCRRNLIYRIPNV